MIYTVFISSGFTWGFYGHRKINVMAVFTLPPEMIGFYKKNIEFLEETSVAPDRRRYAVEGEAPRHFIDLDRFGDSAIFKLPRRWKDASELLGADSLMEHGIVPWHIGLMFQRLKDAFLIQDPETILKVSAELGHYIADANVPLHTTSNYDGQLTGQRGLHGLWESRLPELFADGYDFYVGKAKYVDNVPARVWEAIKVANLALDSVLAEENVLAGRMGHKKFGFETKGKQTVKVVSQEYARAYHEQLNGMVERQMKASIKMTADLWYSAWVDAGQPDLKRLIEYRPTVEELQKRRAELMEWRKGSLKSREHESETIH